MQKCSLTITEVEEGYKVSATTSYKHLAALANISHRKLLVLQTKQGCVELNKSAFYCL